MKDAHNANNTNKLDKDLKILVMTSIKLLEVQEILEDSRYTNLKDLIGNINNDILNVIEDINKINTNNDIQYSSTNNSIDKVLISQDIEEEITRLLNKL